jgi:hypothetical protein
MTSSKSQIPKEFTEYWTNIMIMNQRIFLLEFSIMETHMRTFAFSKKHLIHNWSFQIYNGNRSCCQCLNSTFANIINYSYLQISTFGVWTLSSQLKRHPMYNRGMWSSDSNACTLPLHSNLSCSCTMQLLTC